MEHARATTIYCNSPHQLFVGFQSDMKILLQAIIFSALFIIMPTTATAQNKSEHDAVNLVMQNFIRSFTTGDVNLMRTTARSDGLLIGYSKSKAQVVTQSNEEWSNGFMGKLADDESQRKRSFKILDITDNAAMAKVMLDYPTWKGIDYIALTKIDGKWMIISKSWSGQAKPMPKK
jgi:hypothetical protein